MKTSRLNKPNSVRKQMDFDLIWIIKKESSANCSPFPLFFKRVNLLFLHREIPLVVLSSSQVKIFRLFYLLLIVPF